MKIAFRVDASRTIGSGHLMRCLILARQLREHGAEIIFISRPLPAHLAQEIAEQDFDLRTLAPAESVSGDNGLRHAAWLGASAADDATETLAQLGADHAGETWDWVVVDHYAIDATWETMVRAACRHILVIDDLADRRHDCDALIDQNMYRDQSARYAGLVADSARLFIGPEFAFLRDEFIQARMRLRERSGNVEHLLIYFGGADPENFTLQAVQAAITAGSALESVTVVLGALHPDRDTIERVCTEHSFRCFVQTQEMAKLMSAADLAIGAGGISVFERLYLRLPTLATPISFNQIEQLDYIAELNWVQLYHSDTELTRLLAHNIEAGVTTPPDCVGTRPSALADFMLTT